MKMHLNLATRDLDAAVAFYATLLHAQPVKHFADYALFVSEDPGLELALDLRPDALFRRRRIRRAERGAPTLLTCR